MTAPRYSAPNKKEITTIRPIAPIEPSVPANEGIPQMITADAKPASAEARTEFQTALTTQAITKPHGIPAHPAAGLVRAHNPQNHANATPNRPHLTPKR